MRMDRRMWATLMLIGIFFTCFQCTDDKNSISGNTISISGAWALYPLVVKWAEEYMKLNPAIRVEVSAGGAGKGIVDVLANLVDIGMISREINPSEMEKGVWWIPVAKDAVIPTINIQNPYLKKLYEQGVGQKSLRAVWVEKSMTSWEAILGTGGNTPIHVYTRSDACGAAQVWAEYLGGNQDDLAGVGVYGDPGLAKAVAEDKLGIGFNNINYAYDPKTQETVAGLAILPLDVNENGRLETEENFYSSRELLLAAIKQGKYPSPPARDLYLACNGKPLKSQVKDFMLWILTAGQEFVSEAGYINIAGEELEEARNSLE
jgi:phosphate transport system substrate-binding protein